MGVKVGAVGLVTLMVVVTLHPVFAVYVIIAVPKLIAITIPKLDTMATDASLDTQGAFAAAVPVPVS